MATGQKSSGFWRRPVAAALKRGRRGRSQKGQAAGAIQSSSGPLPTVARQRHNTNGLLVFGTCHVSTALCVSVLRCVCACVRCRCRSFLCFLLRIKWRTYRCAEVVQVSGEPCSVLAPFARGSCSCRTVLLSLARGAFHSGFVGVSNE